MTTRRRSANHTGTSHKRKDGRWEWKISLPDGRRKSFYGATEGEARTRAKVALKDMDQGVDISVKDLTVAQFLNRWIDETAADRVRPSTLRSYRGHIDVHIIKHLGSIKLRNLTPQSVNRMLATIVATGASPTTANRIRATLRTALASAVKWGLVARNVAALSDARKESKVRVKPMQLEEILVFLKATEHDRHGPLFHLAIATGLRQGELFALRWTSDIDLTRGVLIVNHTAAPGKDGRITFGPTKTDQSRRVVRLTESAIAALHRQRELVDRLELLAAESWTDHDLVFPSKTGTFLDGSNVRTALQRALKRAGLPDQRFHDLRHATASLLISEGCDLFTVKEILGHSQYHLTANTYGHLSQKVSEEAASRLNRALSREMVT